LPKSEQVLIRADWAFLAHLVSTTEPGVVKCPNRAKLEGGEETDKSWREPLRSNNADEKGLAQEIYKEAAHGDSMM
jgi:hypothetical protein